MLTKREDEVLNLLANGHSPKYIQGYLGITATNFYAVSSRMKSKTGIRNIRDVHACRHYIRFGPMLAKNTHHPLHQLGKPVTRPTDQQLEAMRLIAQGVKYSGAAETLGIEVQSVQNAVWQGCQRAGISHLTGDKRLGAIRLFLEQLDAEKQNSVNPMDDPMF